MCNLDDLIVDLMDFDCIAGVSSHCTIDVLCKHIREAQDINLSNKIGWGLLDEVINNLENPDYNDLLCGSTFEYCGRKEKHFGLKRVLVHYAYALYKYNGNYKDTSTGTVYKHTADSAPVGEDILKRIRNEHFNLAKEYWLMTEKYLCANKDIFTEFDDCNCKCDCNDCENKTTKVNSRLKKARTFSKYGNNSNKQYRQCNLSDDCGCHRCS